MNFNEFFKQASPWPVPEDWQASLAAEPAGSRLIRIPTGFGKTLGAALSWLWNRVCRNDDTWPRRLVWCLPMRVLVEQTETEIRGALDRLGLLWDGKKDHSGKVGVHVLLGGTDIDEWHLYPEHCAVLIGTQDMLLSRALNRGYGAARARWPIDFGLLNQDCLWVMDEVQLMDVGLATSGQLQAFRAQDINTGKSLRPCHTWWMSATLQRSWLARSPETQPMAELLPHSAIPPDGRRGRLWDDVQKPVTLEVFANLGELAKRIAQVHAEAGSGRDGPTLVVLNRVDDAVVMQASFAKEKTLRNAELCLIHSRFRSYERAAWREAFLNRASCTSGVNRIIMATQVVEAGVDISAAVLVTQLAPWPSLVQRFGRAARWGGSAQIIVADLQPSDDKAAAPYLKDELDAARYALTLLADVAPRQLEAFEEAHPELVPELYPYAPKHLLLHHEIHELFDTTPDLSGADVDISRFIRSSQERDLQLFWQDIDRDTAPDRKLRASREALCAVPYLKARDWLCGKETASSKAPRLKKEMRAWVWDWLDGAWRIAERHDLYPGQTVLVASECGGYDLETGWNPESRTAVVPVQTPQPSPAELADAAQDDEQLSAYPWQTIAVHGGAVAREAAAIANLLSPDKEWLLHLGGRWHDVGKVHEAFQNSITGGQRPHRRDLAKAPEGAWLPPNKLYPDSEGRRRGSFRHELASTLALFEVLVRHQPDHPALLGPWRSLLEAAGTQFAAVQALPDRQPNSVEQEVLALSAEEFDLLAYLVCSHHGKVRLAWHASPADQQAADSMLRIRGICDGEALPTVALATADGGFSELPESVLRLAPAGIGLNPITGRGWTERVLDLLQSHGPFALAYLEALLRAADQRASRQDIDDPLLRVKEAVV